MNDFWFPLSLGGNGDIYLGVSRIYRRQDARYISWVAWAWPSGGFPSLPLIFDLPGREVDERTNGFRWIRTTTGIGTVYCTRMIQSSYGVLSDEINMLVDYARLFEYEQW